MHLWAGSIPAQIDKMRELYHAVPEKPEWLTEQDIIRYERQMSPPAMPVLDEEEISDLVDVVL